VAEERKTIAPWKVLESKYNYRDRWLALRSDTVELPNGRVLAPFHVIEQPDWVTAIAITHESKIVLVEEYRHGARQAVVELPSGIIEGPGTPVEHMKRELLEETGFASDEWHPLGSFFANAPRLNNRVHCFVALDARKVAEPRFLEELRDGSRTFHGFQVGTMWLLHTFARRTKDKRLAALLS